MAEWQDGNRLQKIELNVHLAFDEEANIWFVAASDIPGLRLEAESAVLLIQRIADVAPELIELNEEEILSAHGVRHGGRLRREAQGQAKRPDLSIIPVFDNGLSIAHA